MSRSPQSANEQEQSALGARTSRRRASLTLGLGACFAAMVAGDSLSPGGEVTMDGRWDIPFVDGLGSFQVRPEREIDGVRSGGFRLMGEGESLGLKRLPRRSEVTVQTVMGPLAALHDLDVDVLANGIQIARAPITHAFKVVEGTASTDGRGDLLIQIRSATGSVESPLPMRMTALRAAWRPPAMPPGPSLRLYALIAACAAVWASHARSWGRWVAFVLPAGGIVLLLALATLYARMYLPVLACAAAASTAILLLGRWLGMSVASAMWVAGLAGARMAFALIPAFPSIDALFHAHGIHRFQAGQVITSEVSDAGGRSHAIPYGITLYALLAPFVPPGDYVHGEMAVRLTMALLEGTAPIVIFLIMRAAGASPDDASGAGQIAAALPESLLVIAKGVAANALGQWLGLWAVWGLLRRDSVVLPAVLIGVMMATHPGAAATLATLIVVWAFLLASDHRSRRQAGRLVLCLLAGGLLGILLYYRHVFGVAWSMVSHLRAPAGGDRFWAFRWVHAAKILQDLVLKFGGLPAVMAAAFWTRRRSNGALHPLLLAWLLAYGLLAMLAVFTPLAFRFEYFFAPAVAMAAATVGSGSPWVRRATIAAATIQLALAVAALQGWFDLINVIIPSLRWPLGGVTRSLPL